MSSAHLGELSCGRAESVMDSHTTGHWCVWKVREGFPGRVLPKTLKWVAVYSVWRSTSVDSTCTATGRPLVCILWRGGVSCPVSAAWHSCVAAHWSKYHCYKQAPSQYDLSCLKTTLNLSKQTEQMLMFKQCMYYLYASHFAVSTHLSSADY